MDLLFKKELDLQRISPSPKKPVCIHAIGAVEKKNTSELRPVSDCSRPAGQSINDHIEYPKQRFNSVDCATRHMSPGCYMAIVDISKAYRHVPVRPEHRTYQGSRWMFGPLNKANYEYYQDNFLCFGLSCAPGIFTRITNAVQRMMGRRGYHRVVNYIDDFLVIGDSYEECRNTQLALIHLLISLGFSISWSKVTNPNQITEFLGVTLDSINMEARLPMDKVHRIKTILNEFRSRKKATKRMLSSLIGLLSFASTVVKGGRCFTRRLLDLMNSVSHWHHMVRLNSEFRKDILWWITFIDDFNGRAKLIIGKPMPMSSFQTDASLHGFGCYFEGLWFCGSWQENKTPLVPANIDLKDNWSREMISLDIQDNINYLELFPVLLAARRWGHMFCDQHIVLYSDNQSTISFVNKGTCRNSTAMTWLRELCHIAIKYNFHLTARHLSGKLNVISDALSRLNEPNQWDRLLKYVYSSGVPLFVPYRN